MPDVQPGDIILFTERGVHNLAKVDLVRAKHLSSFPWSLAHRTFERRRRRVDRRRFLAVLPETANLDAISEQLTILKNKRDMELSKAERLYFERALGVALAEPVRTGS